MGRAATSIFNLSAVAVAAIAQHRCVNYGGIQTNAVGGEVKGISMRPAAMGEALELACVGTALIESGGAFAVGAALMSDANGRVIAATSLQVAAGAVAVTSAVANGAGSITGAETPQHLVGYALEASAGAGNIIEVKLA